MFINHFLSQPPTDWRFFTTLTSLLLFTSTQYGLYSRTFCLFWFQFGNQFRRRITRNSNPAWIGIGLLWCSCVCHTNSSVVGVRFYVIMWHDVYASFIGILSSVYIKMANVLQWCYLTRLWISVKGHYKYCPEHVLLKRIKYLLQQSDVSLLGKISMELLIRFHSSSPSISMSA